MEFTRFKQVVPKFAIAEVFICGAIITVLTILEAVKGVNYINKKIGNDNSEGTNDGSDINNHENSENNNYLNDTIKNKLKSNLMLHMICVVVLVGTPCHNPAGVVFCYIHLIVYIVFFVSMYKNIQLKSKQLYIFINLILGVINLIILIIALNEKRIQISLFK